MNPKQIVLINIASNTYNVGRGPIFHDGSFKYVPIPEKTDIEGIEFRFPTYAELELDHYIDSDFRNDRVHIDPDFQNMTYGHAQRRHGYEKILKNLEKGDILAFYATLDYKDVKKPRYEWIDSKWGTYIIGAFVFSAIYTQEEFLVQSYRKRQQFQCNPHFLRKEYGASLWITGSENSPGLFDIAFPLHDTLNRETGSGFLKKHFTTSGGKEAGVKGYYRHAMVCKKNARNVWDKIMKHSIRA
ncbi:MAG: hypothetical protein ACFFD4_30920 [Candidatus Odinarchaeota archaeon]